MGMGHSSVTSLQVLVNVKLVNEFAKRLILLPMQENTTVILLTAEKSTSPERVEQAIAGLHLAFRVPVQYIETDESAEWENSHSVICTRKPGKLWKAMAGAAEEMKATFACILAPSVSGSMLGGGMGSFIGKFTCSVIFMNPQSNWCKPHAVLMHLGTLSESRQKLYPVSLLSKAFFAPVNIVGLTSSKSQEDENYLAIYCRQAEEYMAKKGVRASCKEQQIGTDVTARLLELSSAQGCHWLSVLNETDSDRMFKTSMVQHVCNKATVPLLITPRQEVVGMGGSGY
jgi:hypothetical protein